MTLVPLEAIYTSNDTYTEVPPAGADGFSSATITVDVPSSSSTITIDRINGNYNEYFLSDFTLTGSNYNIRFDPGYSAITIVTTPFDSSSWQVYLQFNASAVQRTLTVSANTYYLVIQANAVQFCNPDNTPYFMLVDSGGEDTAGSTVRLYKAVFNLDFTSVPN